MGSGVRFFMRLGVLGFGIFGWCLPVFAQNLVYTPIASSPVGRTPQAMTAGDFNRDGFLDLATVNSTSDDVSILLSNGNGTFRSAVSFGVGKIPMAVATKDIDQDDILDLVVATSGTDQIVVLKGLGDGSFGSLKRYPSGKGTTFVLLHDIDENGSVDVITANSGRFGYYPPFNVSVLLNKGKGIFSEPTFYETEGRDGMFPTGVYAGDLTGDGLPDVAVTWSQPSWRTPNGLISLLVNQGKGKLSLEKEIDAGLTLSAITGMDLNGDGRGDLVTTSLFTDSVTVLLQDEEGEFVNRGPMKVGFSPVSVAVRDLDGDGQLDLIVTNRDSNSVSVLLNRGEATYQKAGHFSVGTTPSALVVEDFDLDELPDLATADSDSDAVSVLLSGEGDIPLASVSAELVEFEVNREHTDSPERSVLLSNIGLGPLEVLNVEVVGKNPEAFSLTKNQCTKATLKTGNSCAMHILFTPKEIGIHTAMIRVLDNSSGSPRVVMLKGTFKG
ncbi:MAG: FG-GAP-like repeat-containing protein [Nitrospirales bacterium]|nr:VCBS repeat-containing protein [Nitrospira sp.]MDR4500618.1 FG-GAP-like repeat-containing protein [Nitrospirales bacterium]